MKSDIPGRIIGELNRRRHTQLRHTQLIEVFFNGISRQAISDIRR
jgi:hypothetical protein